MSRLPSGVLTMMFTDIEGSTRMLHELGDAYADVLAEHHRLMRHALESRGGTEVGTQGDAFFAVFEDPGQAVAAAIDAQRTLAETGVRVRIGLHRGAITLAGDDYVGIELHRAARIVAAAHGGQIIMSRSVQEHLGAGVELRDLGEHRLKDLTEPEWLYQAVVPGLLAEFPPLKSLSTTNVPMPSRRLIGRSDELAEVIAAVDRDRLVTITGSGGTGKTRLAIQTAIEVLEDFPNGVFFVGLAAVPTDDMVAPAVAGVLGVRQRPGEELATAIAEHLRSRCALLLLDNFEHVTSAASLVSTLLEAAPELRILATSREPLRLSAEREYALLPLTTHSAVELFEDRTSANLASDAAVAELCERLDGLPLAIELAAARTKLLSPAAMLERMEQVLPLLTADTRDVPARQRTLRATIDWSYGLLTAAEQRLFRRLSVFAGGGALEAIVAVCGEDASLVESLIDKSLVRSRAGAPPRCWMLQTIREYAGERLRQAGEEADARRLLADWVESLARQAAPQLLAAGQQQWMERLFDEDQTIRDTIEWSLDYGQPDAAIRIVSLLIDYWDLTGPYEEIVRWLERGLAEAGDLGAEWDVRANLALSLAAMHSGELRMARRTGERAVERAKQTNDSTLRARALHGVAGVAIAEEDFDQAEELAKRALAAANEADDPVMRAFAQNCLAISAFEHGDPERAQQLFSEVTENLRRAGDRRDTSIVMSNLGVAATLNEDYSSAADTFRTAIALSEELGERGRIAGQRIDLAIALMLQLSVDEAVTQLALALPDAASVGDIPGLISGVLCSSGICALRGDDRTAVLLWASAQSAAESHGYPIGGPDAMVVDHTTALAAGRLGIDLENVEPNAIILRGRGLALRDAANHALEIMLATSPVREGSTAET